MPKPIILLAVLLGLAACDSYGVASSNGGSNFSYGVSGSSYSDDSRSDY